MDEGQIALEALRSDLEALLAELDDAETSASINKIKSVRDRGQKLVDSWLEENAKWTEDRYSICVPFGSFAQFSHIFTTATFGIDPLETNSTSYRWYVVFGDVHGNCMVFATTGFHGQG